MLLLLHCSTILALAPAFQVKTGNSPAGSPDSQFQLTCGQEREDEKEVVERGISKKKVHLWPNNLVYFKAIKYRFLNALSSFF